MPLFVAWLQQAVDAGVPEPHAMTLSTIDPDGMPRARVLILKAVDDHGWPAQVRQIRVHDIAELDAELDKAHHKLADDPALVPEEWTSYTVRPSQVEFWQGSPDRRHWRLGYQRADSGWDRARLWP